MEISKLQRQLMDHTMSNGGRNWFATGEQDADARAFDELVECGLATSTPAAKWMGDDVIYRLTPEGISRQKKAN